MPHLFTIANPKLSKTKVANIKETLTAFEKSKEGKTFFEKTGYKGYIEISQKDIADLTPVCEVTKEYLGIK